MEIKYRKEVIRQFVGGVEMETEVLLPDFGSDQEQRPIGVWGQRRLRYIRDYERPLYTSLVLTGKLHDHLADIDQEAQEMLFRLVEQMAKRQGITEALKTENQMLWVQRMNNIRNAAQEVVLHDLIYK
jgi:hypothetical protein